MINHTEIPEELEELIREIIAYEEFNEEEEEWAREWAYIEPPNTPKKEQIIEDTEETWKIEINI